MAIDSALKADPVGVPFSLAGTPVLTAGRYDKVLASDPGMAARVKVYYEGGENATHTHLEEDHLFFVLAGRATFHLGREGEEVSIVNVHEGMLLPRGAYYRFMSSGDENLVMLRVATANGSAGGDDRMGPDGLPLPGHTAANHYVEGVPAPGQYFKAP